MIGFVFAVAPPITSRLVPRPIHATAEPDLPTTAMDLISGPASNSPLLVADPTDSRFVALVSRVDYPVFACSLQVSGDRGRTWLQIDPLAGLPPGVEKCYGPQVAFDRRGTLYFLFVGLAGGGNGPVGAYLTSSRDRGATFSPPVQVLGPHNFGVQLGVSEQGARSRVHLAWLHAASDPPLGGFPNGDNPILSSYSDDGGRTFSTPVRVSAPNRPHATAPILRVADKGHVYVAYYDLMNDTRDYFGLEGPTYDGEWGVVLARSDDGGRTFHEQAVIDDHLVPFERVMLIFTMPPVSIASRGDRLCVTWSDARHGDPDVFSRCSSQYGRKWNRLTRVNKDRIGNGLRQYLPSISMTAGHRIDIVYLERTDLLGRFNTVVYQSSTDGGTTYSSSTQLTHMSSDARIGTRYGVASAADQVEFGGRLALLSRPHDVLAAWPDTRNSSSTSTDQDIVVGGATLHRTGFAFWSPSAVSVSSAGLFVMLAAVARRRRGVRADRHDATAPAAIAGRTE